jgi:hypothetical protein
MTDNTCPEFRIKRALRFKSTATKIGGGRVLASAQGRAGPKSGVSPVLFAAAS